MIKFEWPRFAVVGMKVSLSMIAALLVLSFLGYLVFGKLG